jgi:hypothetical protein
MGFMNPFINVPLAATQVFSILAIAHDSGRPSFLHCSFHAYQATFHWHDGWYDIVGAYFGKWRTAQRSDDEKEMCCDRIPDAGGHAGSLAGWTG